MTKAQRSASRSSDMRSGRKILEDAEFESQAGPSGSRFRFFQKPMGSDAHKKRDLPSAFFFFSASSLLFAHEIDV